MADKPRFSRLEDRSLAAYKAWINGIIKQVTGKEGGRDPLTEEDWRKRWQEYWARTDAAGNQQEVTSS